MAPSCVVDPMDCIFEKRSLGPVLHKRAPTDDVSGESNTEGIIIAVTVGALFLAILFALFFYCLRKRRASKGIGQLQKFLPTFMDQEKTEKYFERHGSSTTLVGNAPTKDGKEPAQPSNAHQRTRSVPVAFAKGVTDHRNRHIERDGSVGQFQQISLTTDEVVLERDGSIKRSASGRSRTRSATVTAPPPAMSSLHRGVSLNKHGAQGSSGSRSDLVEDDEGEQQDKFADGESLVAPNRLSVLLDFDQANKSNRFSQTSIVEADPNFDPTRFSSASVMFDAKRLSQASSSSDDESSKSSAEDFRKSLPPHQHQPSYHTNHNSPTELRSRDMSLDTPLPASQPSFVGGDKQELEDDDDAVLQPIGTPTYSRPEFYPPTSQNAPTQTSMYMPVPAHVQMNNQSAPSSPSPPIPKRPLLPSQQKQMLTASRPGSGNYQDIHRY